jgi:hypothetical protein
MRNFNSKMAKRAFAKFFFWALLLSPSILQAQDKNCWTYVIIIKGQPDLNIHSDPQDYQENTIYISNVVQLCQNDKTMSDIKANLIEKYELREGKYSIYFGVGKEKYGFSNYFDYANKIDGVKGRNELLGYIDDAMKDAQHIYKLWNERYITPKWTVVKIQI